MSAVDSSPVVVDSDDDSALSVVGGGVSVGAGQFVGGMGNMGRDTSDDDATVASDAPPPPLTMRAAFSLPPSHAPTDYSLFTAEHCRVLMSRRIHGEKLTCCCGMLSATCTRSVHARKRLSGDGRATPGYYLAVPTRSSAKAPPTLDGNVDAGVVSMADMEAAQIYEASKGAQNGESMEKLVTKRHPNPKFSPPDGPPAAA